jgi:hypothetical protein
MSNNIFDLGTPSSKRTINSKIHQNNSQKNLDERWGVLAVAAQKNAAENHTEPRPQGSGAYSDPPFTYRYLKAIPPVPLANAMAGE